MSCGGGTQNFRLLDGFVGWDEADSTGLTGLNFDDENGLQLEQKTPDAVPAGIVLAHLPPARLAKGCGRCDWFLIHQSQLLRRDCCAPDWLPVWSEACDQHLLRDGIAVAYKSGRLAVSDTGAKKVWIWARDGEQLVGAIDIEHLISETECDPLNAINRIAKPGPLAFTPWGELLVVDVEANDIWRFSASGEVRGKLSIALPKMTHGEAIDRIAASDDCSIWLVTKFGDDDKSCNDEDAAVFKLWRAAHGEKKFQKASIEQLQKAFKPTGLKAANEKKGFCLEECGSDGLPVTCCFTWNGNPLQTEIPPPTAPCRYEQGQLLTLAIDSGIPRCRWHRVQIDADLPAGSVLSVGVATNEIASNLDKSIKSNDQGWTDFLAGVPHQLDWQIAQPGALDFLINQPAGRYLYLRLRLKGDGIATPVVRRVRLDFPRVTSLDYLPAMYRDNPQAEDFTERFLALFDASIANFDRAIERSPALLDPDGVPDEVLPWLGGFLDVVFDPAWNPELRRKVLHALPDLYRRRGTIAGLKKAIKLVFGVDPAIQELTAERDWGSVAKRDGMQSQNAARLGTVRLFGKSRARFRLNSSSLGNAPLRSYGNPDHDPLLAQVFRFRVLVPPYQLTTVNARQRLEQLIASQKPAHTLAAIRVGGEGFILGNTSTVGVDSALGPLPPSVLGKAGNFHLRRMSLLWHGKHGTRRGLTLGDNSVVGIQTIVQ